MQTISATAQDAFIYGYPMVDLYSILYRNAGDPASPEFKAPLNHLYNTRRVASPEDRAIVAPNCDTPYSYAWLDLRSEPVVITIPPFESHRYVSLMLSDLYTYIIGYVTPRTNGNEGGDFLIVGPRWAGDTPPGIKRVFAAPTWLALAFFRTQLFGPDNLPAVWQIQDGFKVQPLSSYLSAAPTMPAAAPRLDRATRCPQGARVAALFRHPELDAPVHARTGGRTRSARTSGHDRRHAGIRVCRSR